MSDDTRSVGSSGSSGGSSKRSSASQSSAPRADTPSNPLLSAAAGSAGVLQFALLKQPLIARLERPGVRAEIDMLLAQYGLRLVWHGDRLRPDPDFWLGHYAEAFVRKECERHGRGPMYRATVLERRMGSWCLPAVFIVLDPRLSSIELRSIKLNLRAALLVVCEGVDALEFADDDENVGSAVGRASGIMHVSDDDVNGLIEMLNLYLYLHRRPDVGMTTAASQNMQTALRQFLSLGVQICHSAPATQVIVQSVLAGLSVPSLMATTLIPTPVDAERPVPAVVMRAVFALVRGALALQAAADAAECASYDTADDDVGEASGVGDVVGADAVDAVSSALLAEGHAQQRAVVSADQQHAQEQHHRHHAAAAAPTSDVMSDARFAALLRAVPAIPFGAITPVAVPHS